MVTKKIYISLLVLIGLYWLGLSEVVSAKTEQEIRQSIDYILKQRHPQDTPQWWLDLGQEAPPIIIQMYEQTQNPYHQTRLIQGLGWFDDSVAVDFLKKLTESNESMTRVTVLKTLGVSPGHQDLGLFEKFLKHEDPQTRLAAAQALQRKGDENPPLQAETQRILSQYSQMEKQAWIVKKLTERHSSSNLSRRAPNLPKSRFDTLWIGSWKGYALEPEGTSGLKLIPVSLRIEGFDGANRIQGQLEGLRSGVVLPLERIQGGGKKISGQFNHNTLAPSILPFEAELRLLKTETFIGLSIPEARTVVWLRKQP